MATTLTLCRADARGGPAPLTVAERTARLVEEFFAGKSEHTRRAYAHDLGDLAAHLGLADLEDLGRHLFSRDGGELNLLVLTWRNALLDRGLASRTINRRLAALRSFVKLGRMIGATSCTVDVGGLKVENTRDTRGPDLARVQRLLAAAAAQRDPIKAARDVAMLRLLVGLGLRRSEVVGLDLAHVDLAGERLSILGKARRHRETVALPRRTRDALAAWIALRGPAPGHLFPCLRGAQRGERLSGDGLHAIVAKLAERAGIGRTWPHALRHTALTLALDATSGDLRTVRRFSRHADVSTLMVYDDARDDGAARIADLLDARLGA